MRSFRNPFLTFAFLAGTLIAWMSPGPNPLFAQDSPAPPPLATPAKVQPAEAQPAKAQPPAEQAPADATPVPAAATPAPAEQPPAAVATDKPAETPAAKPAELWERLIYLPYKNIRSVFEKQGATVFMPYLEYLKLWERAQANTDPNVGQPPVPAVISESHYKASVNQDLVNIEATYKIQVLGKPWAAIPVRFGNAAVGKLTSDRGNVLLLGTGNGEYTLLFPEQGEFTVTLDLSARVRTSPDGRSFNFDCPTVGITTFDLMIPDADQTVEITPQLISLPVESDDDETHISANLGSTASIAAIWHPRVSMKPDMDLLAGVTNQLSVSIADGLVHADAILKYEVLRGELDHLRIAVPTGHRILGVTSPDSKVKGWKAVAENNRQLLTVEFLSPISKGVTIEVHTESTTPSDAFSVAGIDEGSAVHGIHALDVVRENGQLIVSHAADISLAVERQHGLIRIDASEVPQSARRPNSLYYKFYSADFDLRLSARPVEPRLLVTHYARLIFGDDELRLETQLNYQIERAGVFELTLQVPENLTVDNVQVDDLKEFRVDPNTRILTVALNSKRDGQLAINVSAHRPLDAAQEDQQVLPLLEPLNTARETGTVHVYAPEAIEVITDEAGLVSAQPEPATQAKQLPNLRLASSWSFNRRPVEIPVKTVRKPTRMTANVATTIEATQKSVEVRTRLQFHVEYAGLDTFRFSVPEAIADRIQITSPAPAPAPAIKQQSRAAEAEDGWVVWTVVMQRDVLGPQVFEIQYDLTTPQADADPDNNADADDDADDADAAEEIRVTIQPLRALDLPARDNGRPAVSLAQVSGEIAVLKERALAVTSIPSGEALEAIDVRELRSLPQTGILAYRYYTQPVELTVVATKHDVQQVVETVVSRALVEIVIGRDHKATYRCRYLMRSSERQRLAFDLPKSAELLGMLVDNKSVNPEKNEAGTPPEGFESFFVNVARSQSSDEPFSLMFQFRIGLDSPFDLNGGRLSLPLPRLGSVSQHVVVQQQGTVLWLPDEFAIVSTPPNFVRESRMTLLGALLGRPSRRNAGINFESWIGGNDGSMFDFPTEGRATSFSSLGGNTELEVVWWRTKFYTWILSGTLLILAWVLKRTSWENKLGIVLLVAFAAGAYGLTNPEGVLQGLTCARWGLLAMLAIWLIHAVFGWNTTTNSAPPIELPHWTRQPVAAVIPPPGVFETLHEKQQKK